jgi:hypothetical protein
MLPGFTAEVALGRHRTFTAPLRDPMAADTAKVWPQQRAVTEGPDRSQAPVETCTCPCCIRYHGALVCC